MKDSSSYKFSQEISILAQILPYHISPEKDNEANLESLRSIQEILNTSLKHKIGK